MQARRVAMWAVASVVAASVASGVAQQRPEDRRSWMRPETVTSDDPRRVPVPTDLVDMSRVLVLRGGRIFDGTGAAARPATIVVRGNRIEQLLSAAATTWPREAEVVDVAGRTVLPGLIDLHTHLTYTEPGLPESVATSAADATLRGQERLRFYLESGITSVRDVASDGEVPFVLKRWVAEGRIAGPRVFAAGRLITGTGGHGAEGRVPLGGSIREASGPDDWREAVRENFKAGADLIKLASHFSKAEVAAAVEEAHALGLKATVDAETFYIQWAVDAGVDSVEHPLPRTDETIALMARRGVASVPTLIPYTYIFDESGGYFGSTSRRFTFWKDANLAMLRKMKQAGIKLGIGTDLVMNWFRYMPQPYLAELAAFVEAGFTVPETLVAATKINAEILDLADRLGTIETGKLADLVAVEGEPDRRLDDLARVDLVIRDGRILVRGGQVVIPRHAPAPPPASRDKPR